jgi:hypothetical protein
MRIEDVRVGQILEWTKGRHTSDEFVGKRFRVTRIEPRTASFGDYNVYGVLLQNIGYYREGEEYNCGYKDCIPVPEVGQLDLFE